MKQNKPAQIRVLLSVDNTRSINQWVKEDHRTPAQIVRKALELYELRRKTLKEWWDTRLSDMPAFCDWYLRPASDWHEDQGAVLWCRPLADIPPWVGTPLDDDWPMDQPDSPMYRHWRPIPETWQRS